MSSLTLPPAVARTFRSLLQGAPLNGVRPEVLGEPWYDMARIIDAAHGMNEAETKHARLAAFDGAFERMGVHSPDALNDLYKQVNTENQAARFSVQSAADLMTIAYPPLLWVVEGIFSEGCTLLCGSPKAGKSLMMLGIALGVAMGGACLGTVRVPQADVLYLALEDGPRRIQRRLRKMRDGAPVPDNLHLVFKARKISDGLVEDIEGYVKEHPDIKLVVIDTLARIRKRTGPQQSGQAYQQDYDELQPLTDLAERLRIAIVVVHHTRKSQSDDPMDMVNGTQGAGGSVDTVVILQRVRNSADNAATLHIMGRDLDEEVSKGMVYDALLGSYRIVGDAAQVQVTQDRAALVAALRQSDGPLSAQDVARATGRKYEDVRQMLWKMAEDGVLCKPERGKYALATNNTNNAYNANRTNNTNKPVWGGSVDD